MEDKYHWSTSITKLLINEYERNEFLYNTKHVDYKNRHKRLAAYKVMLNILNAEQSGLQLKDLKRKINGLRSQYFSEKIKVIKSQKTGVDFDSVYIPSVYWYPLLKFLDGSTDSNLNETVDVQFSEENNSCIDYSSATSDVILSHEVITSQPPQAVQNPQIPIRKRKHTGDYNHLLEETIKTMSKVRKLATEHLVRVSSDDEFTTFGKFVACELREINTASDRILYREAKRRIQEVLLSMWHKIDSLPAAIHTRNSFTSESSNLIEEDSSFDNLIIDDDDE